MNNKFFILGVTATVLACNLLYATSDLQQGATGESKSKSNMKVSNESRSIIEATDKNGHTLRIKATDDSGKNFHIQLCGFQPNEVVDFESRSCHEKMGGPITMDKDGKFFMGYAPAVIGKNEGPFSISFSNKNTQLSIKHYWGPIAFFSRPS
jgi:hypothetical protein